MKLAGQQLQRTSQNNGSRRTVVPLLLLVVLGLTLIDTSRAAPESLVNCNEVTIEDRCACNDRVNHALASMRTIVSETQGSSWTAMEMRNMTAMQQVRRERLRSFLAPNCEDTDGAAPGALPSMESHTT